MSIVKDTTGRIFIYENKQLKAIYDNERIYLAHKNVDNQQNLM